MRPYCNLYYFLYYQNPLRLVSDIVKGQYEDISPQYTSEMSSLVTILLSQVTIKPAQCKLISVQCRYVTNIIVDMHVETISKHQIMWSIILERNTNLSFLKWIILFYSTKNRLLSCKINIVSCYY